MNPSFTGPTRLANKILLSQPNGHVRARNGILLLNDRSWNLAGE